MNGMIVSIVAAGPSWVEWTPGDQTWAINMMGFRIPHDILFHMDDCRVQEARAKAGNRMIKGLVEFLEGHGRFITSTVYPEYPGAEAFPFEMISEFFGTQYFNSTVAYAVAYAIWKDAREIRLYGADFTYQNSHKAEAGRGCVEYWLGRAQEQGITVTLPKSTTLMDRNSNLGPYGYDAWTVHGDGTMTPKPIPSAQEIEARYG